jgi:hypothetical protein
MIYTKGMMVFLAERWCFWRVGWKNVFGVYIVFVLFWFILLYDVGSVECVLGYFRVLLYRL